MESTKYGQYNRYCNSYAQVQQQNSISLQPL